ncbi:piggyBac transposable element-derived protein 4-like [Schistocerca americana]|uniref:piggyBac transposable element-derived protein 4-like n=1 Tax=Schistocerca americana TaxID=7009 RepID=UPI001F4FDAE7|nr:piggyBac transposable element-derived protein 4-like [Schistocerca americana]
MSQYRRRLADEEILDVLFNDSGPEGELSDYSEDDRDTTVIHMCLVKKSSIADYWSAAPILHSTFAAKLMSRDRFKSILAMLHINNNDTYIQRGQPNFDPLHKIRPYFDYLVQSFRDSLVPSENLTTDEGMCAFRGRIHFRVYIKNKPEKYGTKLSSVCDSNIGYVLNMEIYTGKGDAFTIIPLFERLLSPYLSKGHTVYMDRFYTSPKVIDFLWSKDTLGVGTVMLNRKEMPKSLKKVVLKKGEMTFRHRPHMMACKWKDTWDVAVLSSKHGATRSDVTVRAKGGHIKKFKPDAVLDYNMNKTGVDRRDQLVAYYPFKKKIIVVSSTYVVMWNMMWQIDDCNYEKELSEN